MRRIFASDRLQYPGILRQDRWFLSCRPQDRKAPIYHYLQEPASTCRPGWPYYRNAPNKWPHRGIKGVRNLFRRPLKQGFKAF